MTEQTTIPTVSLIVMTPIATSISPVSRRISTCAAPTFGGLIRGEGLASVSEKTLRSKAPLRTTHIAIYTHTDQTANALDWIKGLTAEPEVGEIYKGKVVKIVDFGAFVNFFGKRDGLVHVSQIENRRLNHPSDVLKEGQEVKVKLLGFDDRGKVRLSMKVVDQETGEEIAREETAE